MAKIGRNQSCPCGSGLKYKRCHGGIGPGALEVNLHEQLRSAIRRSEAAQAQRQSQQGYGRPIISAEHRDFRVVAVGSTLHWSKSWKTFHDFLRDYAIEQLGRDWFKAELTKLPAQRHPIVHWYEQSIAAAQRDAKKIEETYSSPMTGAQRAFLNLAYNLYLIAHHSEQSQAKDCLVPFLRRLKSDRLDEFSGVLFETYAAAAFLKAGFKLKYEDEGFGRLSHVEFVSTFTRTGKRFSVEVKTRNRAPDKDGLDDDVKRLRVAAKLQSALAKIADHTRVVMVEVNVPDVIERVNGDIVGWPKAALEQIRDVEATSPQNGGTWPSAYVIVTNHAYHKNLDALDVGTQAIGKGFLIPDSGPDVGFNRLKDLLDCERRHEETFALVDSMRNHHDIPATFDGSNPHLAFLPDGERASKLEIGRPLAVPGPDGCTIVGTLVDAVMHEEDKKVTAAVKTDNQCVLISIPVTDAELAAWRRHPETFFGELRQTTGKVNNWLELAKWMYETYKLTSREKLLEWMKDASDHNELLSLSQDELAIEFCERSALGIEIEQKRRRDGTARKE